MATGETLLDLACGTGNYSVALLNEGMVVSGIDISPGMIAAAKTKSERIDFIVADAKTLPFEDAIFAGAVCILAIHHFDDLNSSFSEVNRVLKEGGRFVIFTAFPEQMENYWLNVYFPEPMKRSIEKMPKQEFVRTALRNAKFNVLCVESFLVEPDIRDMFLYSGKHHPNLYLDPMFRRGISSFATADNNEIADSLKELAADLERGGDFAKKTGTYASGTGDYSFIVAQKW